MKICGLTRGADVETAVECGADAVGFVLEPTSPRCVSIGQFLELATLAGPYCTVVAVYGHAQGPYPAAQAYQAHTFSGEPPGPRIMTVSMDGGELPVAAAYLLDSFSEEVLGGTGKRLDWERAGMFVAGCPAPVILAGGLTPENARLAIEKVHPYALDVSSGIEICPGVKDPLMIRDFIQAARG